MFKVGDICEIVDSPYFGEEWSPGKKVKVVFISKINYYKCEPLNKIKTTGNKELNFWTRQLKLVKGNTTYEVYE